ncbi:fungal-specific transcription factor domain-containing protein [Colletotrichum navitas]|uniref:Fungal-specific transcription factor domain-containing protein n=1 Tax=Colletotrichum navitas TaxID=681940 RepID=A0AAD8UYW5_9PEZI|nr:fungal-specific transcription factor domain-containing protein [Colletotrichum navitas]KAK1569358.1 fungal-specific transcription factor domain-containing protein [Colletotrichum navitas]
MPNNYPTIVDGTWSHLKELIADAPCWSCRRRRVRCDAIRPACVKCTRAGIQCLGYGPTKPLLWVGMPRRAKKNSKSRADTRKTRYTDTATSQFRQTCEIAIHIADEELITSEAFDAVPTLPQADTECQILKIPTNPLVVNYGLQSLEYIQYYEQRCCIECSIYEENSVNPFRQFLPLIQNSPLVHHTIVSLAAHHRARGATPLRWLKRLSFPPHDASETIPSRDDAVPLQSLISTHYSSALSHKRRAIQNLRQALAAADHSDSVVVSTLLLIWVELLDSGYQSWRHHLSGMRGLIISRTRSSHPVGKDDSALTPNMVWNFNDYLEEAYVILCTNGSAAGPLAPELKDHAGKLFDQLDRFSCWDWSTSYPEPNYVEERYHLACSYKAAIKVYGRRALLGSDFEPTEMREILEDAMYHMKMIDPQDSHFKGCLWPAFVVGAEASDPAHRLAVTDILIHMYGLLYTRTIERGLHALERIWKWRQLTEDRISWIVYMYEDGEELLLV